MLFRKKAKVNDKNTDVISKNAKSMNALLACVGNEEVKAEMARLREKLQFLNPSSDSDVQNYDKRIKSAINEIDLYILKNGEAITKDPQGVLKLLRDLDHTIEMRKAAE